MPSGCKSGSIATPSAALMLVSQKVQMLPSVVRIEDLGGTPKLKVPARKYSWPSGQDRSNANSTAPMESLLWNDTTAAYRALGSRL